MKSGLIWLSLLLVNGPSFAADDPTHVQRLKAAENHVVLYLLSTDKDPIDGQKKFLANLKLLNEDATLRGKVLDEVLLQQTNLAKQMARHLDVLIEKKSDECLPPADLGTELNCRNTKEFPYLVPRTNWALGVCTIFLSGVSQRRLTSLAELRVAFLEKTGVFLTPEELRSLNLPSED